MKKTMLATLLCGGIIIGLATGCTNTQKANYHYTNEEQIEKEIVDNLSKIAEVTDLTSSNPFDYIKNEYYDNIVGLGNDAVTVLERMYQNGKLTGVNAYLSALAIQDITKCNLYEEYQLEWSTAEEFYDLWKDKNCSFKN